MQFHFKCETLRVLSKRLRYYNKKTDRFRLTNHSRPYKQFKYYHCCIARVFIASVLQSWNQSIRILDHAVINQSIYLGTIMLKKRERWESENFDGKLHLKKQICIDSDRDNCEKHLQNSHGSIHIYQGSSLYPYLV